VTSGDEVEVTADGASVRATVALRQAMPPGSVFLIAGTASDNATALTNGVPRVVEVAKTGNTIGGDPAPAASAALGAGAKKPPT
jgi:anaerobic selenocysteine-containing dehydrogenase